MYICIYIYNCVFCAICTQMRAFNKLHLVTLVTWNFPMAEDPRWRSNFNQHDTGGCDPP